MARVLLSVLVALPAAAAWADDSPTPETVARPEAAVEPSASPLEELDWMLGEWVDAGGDVTVVTNVSWTKNRKFLTRQFEIHSDGLVTLEGTQVIGWDPATEQLRSWTYDSEGGFGEGRWFRDGNRWLVKAGFTLADGGRASAVNVFTYVDADSFRWQSIDREINGELQPSIPEVTVVRQSTAKTSTTTTSPNVPCCRVIRCRKVSK